MQFNLAIKDYPEVQREAKAALSNGNPKPGRSLVVEISLRTSDSESLMLEVWSIGMTTRYLNKFHEINYDFQWLLVKELITLLVKLYAICTNRHLIKCIFQDVKMCEFTTLFTTRCQCCSNLFCVFHESHQRTSYQETKEMNMLFAIGMLIDNNSVESVFRYISNSEKDSNSEKEE